MTTTTQRNSNISEWMDLSGKWINLSIGHDNQNPLQIRLHKQFTGIGESPEALWAERVANNILRLQEGEEI